MDNYEPIDYHWRVKAIEDDPVWSLDTSINVNNGIFLVNQEIFVNVIFVNISFIFLQRFTYCLF